MSEASFVGVDFGATNLKAGLVNSRGKIVARASTPTLASEGKERVLSRIVELVDRLKGDEEVTVGVASPGPVEGRRGIVYSPPNLPGWGTVDLEMELEVRLRSHVYVENDANMAAYGEWKFGAARSVQSAMCLTLGTGIGSGLILEGRLHGGAHGFAGELGHMIVEPRGPLCGCGARGCLEALAGADAIVRRAELSIQAGARTRLSGGDGTLTVEEISAAAREGDPLAVDILRRVGEYVGLAVSNAVVLLDVEMVVVGGGVSRAGELLLGPIRDKVSSTLMNNGLRNLEVVASDLGDDAAILGIFAYSADREP